MKIWQKMEKIKNEKQNIKIIKNIKNKQQLAFPWSITASDTTITASNTTTICHYCLCHQYYYCQWHCYCRRNFFPTSETTIVDGALQVYDAKGGSVEAEERSVKNSSKNPWNAEVNKENIVLALSPTRRPKHRPSYRHRSRLRHRFQLEAPNRLWSLNS